MEQRQSIDQNEFDFKAYNWNPIAKAGADRLNRKKRLLKACAILCILLAAYMKLTKDIWGFGTFVSQLLMILELEAGIWLVIAARSRKRSYRWESEIRRDYAFYLYYKQYRRYPAVANQMLFIMTHMDIRLAQYERAAQTLTHIRTDKCNALQLKQYALLQIIAALGMGENELVSEALVRYLGITDVSGVYPSSEQMRQWVKEKDIDAIKESLEKVMPDKKEHPFRIGVITAVLAYSTFFYGLWYGVNRTAGYELRYCFTEVSAIVVPVSLAVLVVWGIISLYRNNRKLLLVQSKGRKLAHTLMYVLAAILLLSLLGLNCLSILLFGIKGTVTKSEKTGRYTYITITEDYGQTKKYRADNPFIMQNTDSLWMRSGSEEQQGKNDTSSETANDEIVNEGENSTDTSQTESSDQTLQQDGLTIQNGMLAVYNFLKDQNMLQNMAFGYTANAKGEVYAIISEGQEEKDGSTVNVRYCLYDNGAKMDENGKSCEEFVLEKVYPDGNYETELVDFYLVDTENMQVTDEQKTTW